MKKRLFILISTVCLSLLSLNWLYSITNSIESTFAKPLSPPVHVAEFPPANSVTSTIHTDITATFDQPISSTTVNSSSFVVHAMQTGVITGIYNVTGGNITFSPTHTLKSGEIIEVAITTKTLSINNEEPLSPSVWQFRAESIGGTANYIHTNQKISNGWVNSVSLGDLNQDGSLDLFLGIADGDAFNTPSEVWLNDGNGNFIDTGQEIGNSQSYAVLGDLDNDGDLDTYVGNHGAPDKVWLNDGNGNFAGSGQSFANLNTRSLDIGDLNGDGVLDIFIVYWGGAPSNVFLNNGAGFFTDTNQSIGQNFVSIQLGDLDNDDDLDAFLGSDGGKIWLNDGDGNFTDSGQALGSKLVQDVQLGDLDGDGDLDAFLSHYFGLGNQVWINNGMGVFTQTAQTFSDSKTFAASLGDLDSDGDLDVIVVNNNYDVNDPDQIWLNDGTGHFIKGKNFGVGNVEKRSVDLGDINNDGSLDIIMGSLYDPVEVWVDALPTYLPLVIKSD